MGHPRVRIVNSNSQSAYVFTALPLTGVVPFNAVAGARKLTTENILLCQLMPINASKRNRSTISRRRAHGMVESSHVAPSELRKLLLNNTTDIESAITKHSAWNIAKAASVHKPSMQYVLGFESLWMRNRYLIQPSWPVRKHLEAREAKLTSPRGQ